MCRKILSYCTINILKSLTSININSKVLTGYIMTQGQHNRFTQIQDQSQNNLLLFHLNFNTTYVHGGILKYCTINVSKILS